MNTEYKYYVEEEQEDPLDGMYLPATPPQDYEQIKRFFGLFRI